MRDMTSEPPKRCGFSNDASATSSPVSRSISRSDDRRRAQVHRQAVNRPGRSARSLRRRSIHDPVAIADDRLDRAPSALLADAAGCSACRSMRIWPRRIVWHSTSPSSAATTALARQPESTRRVPFVIGGRREQLHALRHLDDALLAFALGDAGRGHAHARQLGSIEERLPDGASMSLSVDGERDRIGRATSRPSASSSALTASATSCAGPAAPAPRSTATAPGSRPRPCRPRWAAN